MKFYCSLERLLANHNTYARARTHTNQLQKALASLRRPARVSGAAEEHREPGWLGSAGPAGSRGCAEAKQTLLVLPNAQVLLL